MIQVKTAIDEPRLTNVTGSLNYKKLHLMKSRLAQVMHPKGKF